MDLLNGRLELQKISFAWSYILYYLGCGKIFLCSVWGVLQISLELFVKIISSNVQFVENFLKRVFYIKKTEKPLGE